VTTDGQQPWGPLQAARCCLPLFEVPPPSGAVVGGLRLLWAACGHGGLLSPLDARSTARPWVVSLQCRVVLQKWRCWLFITLIYKMLPSISIHV
jgi:hypothetical protein